MRFKFKITRVFSTKVNNHRYYTIDELFPFVLTVGLYLIVLYTRMNSVCRNSALFNVIANSSLTFITYYLLSAFWKSANSGISIVTKLLKNDAVNFSASLNNLYTISYSLNVIDTCFVFVYVCLWMLCMFVNIIKSVRSCQSFFKIN